MNGGTRNSFNSYFEEETVAGPNIYLSSLSRGCPCPGGAMIALGSLQTVLPRTCACMHDLYSEYKLLADAA